MALLSVSNAHLAYGHVALLDGTGFSLEAATSTSGATTGAAPAA
jgi:hypothetical protein